MRADALRSKTLNFSNRRYRTAQLNRSINSRVNFKQDMSGSNLVMLSVNVNGIRAAYKKGFLDWLYNTNPYILCLQETRADPLHLCDELLNPVDYYTYWNSGAKAGYSGTALFSKEKPISIQLGLGIDKFDQEGRVIIAEYQDFTLINCYFPNGGRDHSRVPFKLAFYNAFLSKCEEIFKTGKNIIFCGDVNTAHHKIDLARPKANKNKTGFLAEERAWIDRVIEAGYIDTFRWFFPDKKDQFTWWSNRANARQNNVGWRLDYFFVKSQYLKNVSSAFIMPDVVLSDHCPVGISLIAQVPKTKNSKKTDKFQQQYHQLELFN